MMELSLFQTVKRYLLGAIVGLVVAGLAALGVNELPPEQLANVHSLVDALLTFVFYVVTIVVTKWRQNKAVKNGEIVQERLESSSTAKEHGVSAGGVPLGRPVNY